MRLYVWWRARAAFLFPFLVTETEPPPNSQQSFLANWRFIGPEGRMKQSTLFPVISFETATVSLYTSNTSLIGTRWRQIGTQISLS